METFELSLFKTFDVDNRNYLFLVSQNAIFEADAEMVEIIARAADQCNDTPQSRHVFLDIFPGSSKEKQETFERWGRIGLLRSSGTSCAVQPDSGSWQNRMPIKTLVLHVTDACNLACRYCYYHGNNRPTAAKVMSSRIARDAVDFLMDASGPLDQVELVFFGGEPLLHQKGIAEIVNYAREKAAKKGKTVDFALTTNATLLDEKTVAFLTKERIGVTVSIDGLPEIHDRYRRFSDGSPSHAIIEPGIRRLIRAANGKPVVARVTVAGNPGRVPDSLDYLLDLGFAEAGFAPVTTTDGTYQLGAEAMEQLLSQFEVLSQRFLEHACENRFYGFTNLIDLLVVLHEGEVKSYPCGAGLGLFSVSADGDLYLCQRLTGEKEAAMGDIYKGIDGKRVETFRQSVHLSAKPQCRECWAQVICAGGCYHEALVREGELTAANLHYCDWIKRWIENGIQVYGRLQSQNPDYLDKLSALRGHETRMNQVI